MGSKEVHDLSRYNFKPGSVFEAVSGAKGRLSPRTDR